MTDSRREMPMNEDLARRVLASEFHPTSGFSKDDPTLIAAKNYIAGLEAERTRSLALETENDRLREAIGRVKRHVCGDRIPNWADHMRTTESRGWIADVCDAALPYQNQQPGSKESGA